MFAQTPFEVYTIEYTENGVTTIDYLDYPATSYIIMGMNYTEYTIRLALNNSVGLGDFSSPVTVRANNVGKFANILYQYYSNR